MPFDGAGNFTRVHNWVDDADNGIKIVADRHDEEDDGFADAFNQALLRTGVAPMTGDLKMGDNRIGGLNAGTDDLPAVTWAGDVTTGFFQPSAGVLGISVGATERGRWSALGLSLTNAFLGVNTATPRSAVDIIGATALEAVFEKAGISAFAATGAIILKVKEGVQYVYTANAVANFSFDITWDTGVDLDDKMAVGQSCTLAIEVPQGAVGYFCTGIEVDGNAPAQELWFNGGTPVAGNINTIDVYTITIIKTGADTFKVRASQNAVQA